MIIKGSFCLFLHKNLAQKGTCFFFFGELTENILESSSNTHLICSTAVPNAEQCSQICKENRQSKLLTTFCFIRQIKIHT